MDPHPEMAAMLAQLADPLRLSLLFELAGGPLPAGALAEATGAPVAEVAPQLGALVERPGSSSATEARTASPTPRWRRPARPCAA